MIYLFMLIYRSTIIDRPGFAVKEFRIGEKSGQGVEESGYPLMVALQEVSGRDQGQGGAGLLVGGEGGRGRFPGGETTASCAITLS
jgi:hypothetical protein